MTAAIAMQVGLLCLLTIGVILWVASPTGRPWDSEDECSIERCRWHGRGRR